MARYGWIRIHLLELMEQKGLSKNKLCQRAEMERTQLNRYCNNTVARMDADVLARLCTVLECGVGDLLEFVPPEQEKTEKTQTRRRTGKKPCGGAVCCPAAESFQKIFFCHIAFFAHIC